MTIRIRLAGALRAFATTLAPIVEDEDETSRKPKLYNNEGLGAISMPDACVPAIVGKSGMPASNGRAAGFYL